MFFCLFTSKFCNCLVLGAITLMALGGYIVWWLAR